MKKQLIVIAVIILGGISIAYAQGTLLPVWSNGDVRVYRFEDSTPLKVDCFVSVLNSSTSISCVK